jgi:hypothetical protein
MFEDFASEVKYLIDTANKVREQKQKGKGRRSHIFSEIKGNINRLQQCTVNSTVFVV